METYLVYYDGVPYKRYKRTFEECVAFNSLPFDERGAILDEEAKPTPEADIFFEKIEEYIKTNRCGTHYIRLDDGRIMTIYWGSRWQCQITPPDIALLN